MPKKMPASKFLVQTEEEVFDELVKASTLPCFTTDYITNRDLAYPDRVNIPIADEGANVIFYIISRIAEEEQKKCGQTELNFG